MGNILEIYSYHIYGISVFILFLLSAFFSGSETSIVSSSRARLEKMMNEGKKSATRALYILDNVEETMGAILIGNNVANIAAAAFITFIATRAFMLGGKDLLIITVVQTVIFLIFCEISPKVIARSKSESYLMFFSYPIIFLMKLFKPLIRISLFFSTGIKKLFRLKKQSRSIVRSRYELDLLFKLGRRDGVIYDDYQVYVSEILSFKDVSAFDIMIPTIDIVSIEVDDSLKSLIDIIDRTRFSRIPVYRDRVDNIIGYIFYRDILINKNITGINEIITRPLYIPETKNIFELYQEMHENTVPLVFVVNEYGAVIGLVSREDIAEEIVGEIQTGEHPHEELITEINENKYILSGDIDIDFFQRIFQIAIEKRGFKTLAGFITYMLKRIPKKGDRLKYNKITFIIDEATDRSVEKVVMLLPKK